MSKETFNFEGVSDMVLLRELLRRNVKTDQENIDDKICFIGCDAPTKIDFIENHYEIIVGIGKDNHAKIYLTQDDANALNDLLQIKEAK